MYNVICNGEKVFSTDSIDRAVVCGILKLNENRFYDSVVVEDTEGCSNWGWMNLGAVKNAFSALVSNDGPEEILIDGWTVSRKGFPGRYRVYFRGALAPSWEHLALRFMYDHAPFMN